MVFDNIIIFLAVILAISGWNRGLLRSWRGPLAIVITVLLVQHIYINFAAWLTLHLYIAPVVAVFVSYLMLWLSLEAFMELILAVVLRDQFVHRQIFFDRLGGVCYGLIEAIIILVLPVMATAVKIDIPPPPDGNALKLVLPDIKND